MISGAHITIGSKDAEADKAFFVNVPIMWKRKSRR